MSHVPRPDDRSSEGSAALASRLYSELKSIARWHLMRERYGHTLQPTALVHEAYIRMAKSEDLSIDRERFLAHASITMRRVLIDYARRRGSLRRGGSQLKVTLAEGLKQDEPNLEVFALEEALRDLEAMDARPARIVEMRLFGGLTDEEIAAVLNISTRTVKRDWIMARTWLQQRMDKGSRA